MKKTSNQIQKKKKLYLIKINLVKKIIFKGRKQTIMGNYFWNSSPFYEIRERQRKIGQQELEIIHNIKHQKKTKSYLDSNF